jgi:hypothetical protein
MNTIKKLRFYIVSLLLSAFAFSSCLKEVFLPISNGENDVTIVINVPGGLASSRAIIEGSADDNAVNRIDVLMFDINNGLRYAGRVIPVFINEIDLTTKSFTISVPEGNFVFMILANAKDIIDDAPLVVGTTTKAGAYTLLTESLPIRTGVVPPFYVWNANPSSIGYKDFPMWGEVTIDARTATTVNTKLVRMLAKINVKFYQPIDAPTSISDKLSITEIHLCNYNTRGFLASTGWTEWNPPLFTLDGLPNLPDPVPSAKLTGYGNRLVYPASAIINNTCIDEIFLFEVAAPTDNSIAQRRESTCLIIVGHYDGSPDLSYYRVDIVNSAGTYLNILRNHHYEIIIQDVKGPGAPTGEIAYDSELITITATVRVWNAGYDVNINYPGQFRLITNRSEFTLASSGMPAQSFLVFSDNPGGWEVEPGYPSWIRFNPAIPGNANTIDFTNVEIYCDLHTDIDPRTGEFWIRTKTAPIIRKKITVTQMPPPVPIGNETIVLEDWRASVIIQPVALADDPAVNNARITLALNTLASLSNTTGFMAPEPCDHFAIYFRNAVTHDIIIDMTPYNDKFITGDVVMFDAKKLVTSWGNNGTTNYELEVTFNDAYWEMTPAWQTPDVDGVSGATTTNPTNPIRNLGSIILIRK